MAGNSQGAGASSSNPYIPSQMSDEEFDFYFPVPEGFLRTPSGSTVVEPDSILDESGRSYHGYKQGKYVMPNDAAEQDRLDFQHTMISLTLDGNLALAPLPQPPRFVLDVACGTGVWSIEYAQQNPTAHVIGTDLSKIQPETHLPNCEFIKDDCEERWLYPHVPAFDYVHLRLVSTFEKPKKVMSHAFENLRAGGWIEYQDIYPMAFSHDGSHEGTIMQQYWDYLRQGLEARGRDAHVPPQYKNWLKEAGFVEITERIFEIPGNAWPTNPKQKRIGQYTYVDLCDGVQSIGLQILRGLGLSAAEVEDLLKRFKVDSANKKYKVYYKFYVVYARKPFQGEAVTKVEHGA